MELSKWRDNVMQCVRSLEEIKHNMMILDYYLDHKTESTYSFALSLVKKGTCFIAQRVEDGYRFYPSRFIGYVNNTMDKHLANSSKDGKETNPAISRILEKKVDVDAQMEQEYQTYCRKLGFEPNEKGSFGVTRKYWRL